MDPIKIAGAAAALAAGLAALFAFWKVTRKLIAFVDEMVGEPAAFGRPAKPGIVERLDSIGTTQDEHTEQIQRILHELYPNSGTSLRDAVDRLERQASTTNVAVNVNPPAEH